MYREAGFQGVERIERIVEAFLLLNIVPFGVEQFSRPVDDRPFGLSNETRDSLPITFQQRGHV